MAHSKEVVAAFHWEGQIVRVYGIYNGTAFKVTRTDTSDPNYGPKMPPKLLGDKVAGVIETVTGKKSSDCPGCGNRKKKLNDWHARRIINKHRNVKKK